MMTIRLIPDLPPITKNDHPDAVCYIQNDAPGYHVEFYPMDPARDPPLTPNDCQVYGIDSMAIQICLMNNDSGMTAGTEIGEA